MRRVATIIIVALLAGLNGCASTQPMAGAELSGFLDEYAALLRPVGQDHAHLLYRDPTINWAAYSRVLLEPVTIWGEVATPLSDGQREDLQRLADSFYQTLALKLGQDYALVDKPASGAMRVQAAVASGQGARTEQMFASKVILHGQAANMLWTFGSSKPPFAGDVAIAFMVKDARTGDLLAAGVDRRGTGRTLFRTEAFDSWREVRDSVEYWIDASLYRLCLLRGGPHCINPAQ